MTWSWGSFGIGLATLPALVVAFLLVQALVVELFLRRQESIGCGYGHCEWELDAKPLRWIGHRRRTLHVMRNHPRASATFLRVHATGELPFKIAKRAVAAQDAAGVKATPLSLWTDVLSLLPGGEKLSDALLFRGAWKGAKQVGWFSRKRQEWSEEVVEKYIEDPRSATRMRRVRDEQWRQEQARKKREKEAAR